ncbi:MAG: alpha/beta fold hydrolase [Acidobacteria bacterium]|nr:alpha/beta fold hydrolase [Acidobacteriota bacterium]
MSNAADTAVLDERRAHVGPAGIEIAYQRLGDPAAPPVLLIMGLGAQLIHWPDPFCHALVKRDLQVIRFDNRDAGHSARMAGAPPPNLPAALSGDLSSASYTLSDMAADAVGLLDALDIAAAHVVGASMGGAIAQTAAIEHPGRLRSVTSIMSTTGAASVGQPSPDVLRELFSGPAPTTRDEFVERMCASARLIGSPGYPGDEAEISARAARVYERGYDSVGLARQAVATVASGDRTGRLRQLEIPALVIHGLADRMCDASGGRAVAQAIPGAELVLIEGMGHDLPPGLRAPLATRIADFIWNAERR